MCTEGETHHAPATQTHARPAIYEPIDGAALIDTDVLITIFQFPRALRSLLARVRARGRPAQ